MAGSVRRSSLVEVVVDLVDTGRYLCGAVAVFKRRRVRGIASVFMWGSVRNNLETREVWMFHVEKCQCWRGGRRLCGEVPAFISHLSV